MELQERKEDKHSIDALVSNNNNKMWMQMNIHIHSQIYYGLIIQLLSLPMNQKGKEVQLHCVLFITS